MTPVRKPCTHLSIPTRAALYATPTAIILHASVAMFRFVLDYPFDGTDLPRTYPVSERLFLADGRPHYLICIFPSCTLRVHHFPDLFLTRFTLRVPPTFKPSVPDRRSSIRRF